MPKEIKAIQCPKCGATQKTEIKPDYFRCDNCGTEYFLDNDDVNVNIRYSGTPTAVNPNANKQKVGILIGCIGFIFLVLFIFIISSNDHKSSRIKDEYRRPTYDFNSNGDLVYTNTLTNSPVYLRIGREDMEGTDHDFVNVHLVFIDPMAKKQFKDVLLYSKIRRLDDHDCYFHRFINGEIYAVYNKTVLFKLDARSNTLIDITASFINKHAEVSSGIAKITLGDSADELDFLTNDGTEVFYSPLTDQFYPNYNGSEDAKFKLMQKPFYQFIDSDQIGIGQVAVKLVKFTSTDDVNTMHYKNLTGSRKFFGRQIVYQDTANLIIFAHISPVDTAPTTLQSIDVNTGKIKWAVNRSSSFRYDDGAKCKQGFAIHYSSGEDMDYISGVYVIAPDGKMVSDYTLKRNE